MANRETTKDETPHRWFGLGVLLPRQEVQS
jgi:hypothetical protein